MSGNAYEELLEFLSVNGASEKMIARVKKLYKTYQRLWGAVYMQQKPDVIINVADPHQIKEQKNE